MTAPDHSTVELAALTPATRAGAELVARLTAILATLGLVARGLPDAARIPSTSKSDPRDHLTPGLYLVAHGDAVVLIWHAVDYATEHEHPDAARPALLSTEDLMDGLVATLRSVGTVGPLAERIDAPSTFRPSLEVTWPETADVLSVVVEQLPVAVTA